MTARSREFDVVVYGATGFVGRLLAEYLAQHAPAGTRIALAGRSVDKLAKVRSGLGAAAADWPLVRADATDAASLRALADSTLVVATTVGPYAKYGLLLVRACAEAGTDYVDLTGETSFVRDCIDLHHDTAVASGARIVHACGFDSVPSDLGVHVLHRRVQADGAGELTDATLVVTAMRGGVSGGTIDSMRLQLDIARRDPAVRRNTASPYSLSPDRAAEPDLGRQTDLAVVRGSDIAPGLRGWKAPFFMGLPNSRIVRRSNALTGYAYGKRLRYREVMSVGTSPLSPLLAAGVAAGIGGVVAGLLFPPTRWALARLLPKAGEGPSETARRKGYFTIDLYGRTTTDDRYTVRFAAKGDPGYAATSVMLGESALALALQRDELPDRAGILTPATALGDVLADRLRDAGFDIRAQRS